MLFWTLHFLVLDSTYFVLDSTFWLDSTLKIDPVFHHARTRARTHTHTQFLITVRSSVRSFDRRRPRCRRQPQRRTVPARSPVATTLPAFETVLCVYTAGKSIRPRRNEGRTGPGWSLQFIAVDL